MTTEVVEMLAKIKQEVDTAVIRSDNRQTHLFKSLNTDRQGMSWPTIFPWEEKREVSEIQCLCQRSLECREQARDSNCWKELGKDLAQEVGPPSSVESPMRAREEGFRLHKDTCTGMKVRGKEEDT
jgi:hypothetical protein